MQYCGQAGNRLGLVGDPGAAEKIKQWQKDSLHIRGKMQVSPTYAPWTSRNAFKGVGLSPSDRVHDLVDCAAIYTLVSKGIALKDMEAAMKGIILDVSQSHGRRCFTQDGIHKCLTTSSSLYAYHPDRMITPLETLWFQGYPRTLKMPATLSGGDIKEFVGEGVCLPCMATVIWAVISVVPLWDAEKESSGNW